MPRATLILLLLYGGATWALPQVDCVDGQLVGTDAESVFISIDDQIVEIGPDGVDLGDFCFENPDLVGYVLPVPKPSGGTTPEPPPFPEPGTPGQPSMGAPAEAARGKGTQTFSLQDDAPRVAAEAGEADPADEPAAEPEPFEFLEGPIDEPAPSPARADDAPTETGPDGSPVAGGCDATGAPSMGWLGLLLLALRRRGGAR